MNNNKERLSRLLARQLKARIREVNEQLGSRIAVSGTKGSIVSRMDDYLQELEQTGAHDALQRVWSILEREDSEPEDGHASPSHSVHSPVHYELLTRLGDDAPPVSPTPYAAASGISGHSPYRRANRERLHVNGNVATNPPTFRPCPFYLSQEILSEIAYAEGSRRWRRMTGTKRCISCMPRHKVLELSTHRVMVYCVDAAQWLAKPYEPMPVEFPPVLELSINHVPIRKNLRGIKNRPGTVHPVDITAHCCLKPGASNELNIVYINTPKRYAFTVWLVEAKAASDLVDVIKQRKPFEKENTQQLHHRDNVWLIDGGDDDDDDDGHY
ncbi:PINIT domain-containing protein [Syncephalis pseudoplumigaleata]|uniref:PINIT domain-containing protein n=1 Tax=Syncephalis pseudoplumigaleata TaxID=1712513 RepID=A0A4P9YV70_9FUNG|nr:PINIT domain-containing protein [Syncephalis pseudoplumigaleata]|eukprot:RKP23688.1 PINIT domain-containing protein [Syncephalis pseudoplumigaleata]